MPKNTLPEIDRMVHEPARLLILGHLCAVEVADFVFLMQQTGLTQGNLSSHMSKLEAAGLISVKKKFVHKRPRTMLRLTSAGRAAIEEYARTMKQLIGQIPIG